MSVELKQTEGGKTEVVYKGADGHEKVIAPEELDTLLTGQGAPFEDQAFSITVDGSQVQLTGKELKERASKAAGADKRFEEASKMRADAEDSIRLASLIKEVRKMPPDGVDMNKLRELGRLMGADNQTVETFIENAEAQLMGTGGIANPATSTGKVSEDDLLNEEDLHPKLRAKLKRLEELDAQAQKDEYSTELTEVKNTLKSDLTADPVFGKLIKQEGGDSKRVKALVEAVFKEVRSEVAFSGKAYGPELRRAAIQKVRQELADLGTHTGTDGQDALASLGQAPGLTAGPNVLDEPVKRVPPSDPNYGKNLAMDFIQKVRQAGGKVDPDVIESTQTW